MNEISARDANHMCCGTICPLTIRMGKKLNKAIMKWPGIIMTTHVTLRVKPYKAGPHRGRESVKKVRFNDERKRHNISEWV